MRNINMFNEAPRIKLRGIKAELRRSLIRLRSGELPPSLKLRRDMSARFTSPSSVRSKPFAKTDHPCSPPKNCGGQGILAKANKLSDVQNDFGLIVLQVDRSSIIVNKKSAVDKKFRFQYGSHLCLTF